MNKLPINRSLQLIISSLVVIIAGSSFLLSYVNLRRTAIEAGIPEDLAFLWPLCLDAFLVLSSIYILRSSLRNERTWPGWIVLITFTIISVGFNIQDSKSLISVAAHALPPVALCLSLELFMEMVRITSVSDNPVIIERSETDHPATKGDQILDYLRLHPDQSGRKAAQTLGCSPATVTKYREKLKSELPYIPSGDE